MLKILLVLLFVLTIADPAIASDRLAARVHDALNNAASGQVVGVSINDPRDKTTWRLDFTPSASAAQRQQARDALTAFDRTAVDPVISTGEMISRFTVAEQAALWRAAKNDDTGVIGATLNRVLARQTVDLSATGFDNWLDLLVNAGVITSERKATIKTP